MWRQFTFFLHSRGWIIFIQRMVSHSLLVTRERASLAKNETAVGVGNHNFQQKPACRRFSCPSLFTLFFFFFTFFLYFCIMPFGFFSETFSDQGTMDDGKSCAKTHGRLLMAGGLIRYLAVLWSKPDAKVIRIWCLVSFTTKKPLSGKGSPSLLFWQCSFVIGFILSLVVKDLSGTMAPPLHFCFS